MPVLGQVRSGGKKECLSWVRSGIPSWDLKFTKKRLNEEERRGKLQGQREESFDGLRPGTGGCRVKEWPNGVWETEEGGLSLN